MRVSRRGQPTSSNSAEKSQMPVCGGPEAVEQLSVRLWERWLDSDGLWSGMGVMVQKPSGKERKKPLA